MARPTAARPSVPATSGATSITGTSAGTAASLSEPAEPGIGDPQAALELVDGRLGDAPDPGHAVQLAVDVGVAEPGLAGDLAGPLGVVEAELALAFLACEGGHATRFGPCSGRHRHGRQGDEKLVLAVVGHRLVGQVVDRPRRDL